jgi:ribosomal protein S18 acetylase RimI-like enzyme
VTVSLRPMTEEEFVPYEDDDAHRYAQAMVSAGYWSAEGALERAKETHAKLLPQGVSTKDHLFFVIEQPPELIPIGAIWLSINRETLPASGFVYDLILHQRFRGRGLGREAMEALEEEARRLRLTSLALHVFEDNTPARTLYTALGYQVKSMNMTKALAASEK